MYRIEKIGKNCFYIKFTGLFSVKEAEKYVEDFKEKTKELPKFTILVDLMDARILGIKSIDIVLAIVKKESNRLEKSVYVISENPPLEVEFQYLFSRAPSPKRKIVSDLEEAKKELNIEGIIIKKD